MITGIFLLILLFAGRTLYIQLIRGVDKDIVKKVLKKGKRGTIYDRNEKKLAYDIDIIDIFLDESDISNSYEVALFMNKYFDLNIPNTISLINASSGYLAY